MRIDWTPFIPALSDRVEAALRRLLSLDDAIALDWRLAAPPTDGGLGHLEVGLVLPRGGGELTLDLADAARTERSFAAAGRVALSYRMLPDGADPWAQPALAAVLREAAAAFRGGASRGDDGALVDAVAAGHRYADLEDWVFREVHDDGDPANVAGELRLGFRCNQRCGVCWQDRGWPDAPEEVLTRWLDELAAAGVRSVMLTGGEPTLHPALPRLVARAVQRHKMAAQLQTNAIRLGRGELLAALIDAGLSSVFISYHAADPTLSERITRAPGTHAHTVAGIAACLDAGLHVHLNCVVDGANCDHLPAHAADIRDRFGGRVTGVVYSNPVCYRDEALWRESVAPLDTVRPHLLAAITILTAAGITVEAGGTCGFPPCLFHEAPALVRPIDPGGIRALTSGRRFAPECDRCALRERCLGLREEYVMVHGLTGVRPFDTAPGA